ncbi:Tim44-like domain protein [Candidatus Bealeia paramacronuclearis]|uniref:Tim44-like domain protein n=1 Tax=Candidatus Bealeia paramacronuclearis TaxID=1921001 RepID=A0ABZ2C4J6_9PROT|nr:Tim44-like domain protein [Candidatus Bealeia paramacronuclearis]
MAHIDIFLFALVAIFVGYRLWMVLGTHDPNKPIKKKNTLQGEEVGSIVRSQTQPERSKIQAVPTDGFDEEGFLHGAEVAFKMILEAYSQGNKTGLSKLLSPEMLSRFSKAIDARHKKGQVLETNLYRVIMSRILDRKTDGHLQKIRVKFVSEQCVLIRGKDGQLLEGDASSVEEITDIWTFERETRSGNPNWTLVETEKE